MPTLARTSSCVPADHERLHEQVEEALGRDHRAVHAVRLLEQDGEFVATETSRGIGGACGVTEPLGNRHQQLVTGGMTQAVVDGLEVVDVDEQHGDRVPAPRGTVESVADTIGEERSVRQTGEGVVECLMDELILQLASLGDVVRGDDDALDGRVVEQVADHAFDRSPTTVTMTKAELELRARVRRSSPTSRR